MNTTSKRRKMSRTNKFSKSAFDIPVLNFNTSKSPTEKRDFLFPPKKYEKLMENVNNISNRCEIPFEEYSKGISSTMKQYKIDSSSKTNPGEPLIEISKPQKKQYIGLFNKSFIKQSPTNMSNHRISIFQEEYKNPLDSFISLQLNKNIYNKVVTNNISREINKFFNAFNNIKKSVSCNLKKVKVSNVLVKTNDLQTSGKSYKTDLERLANTRPSGSTDLYGYYLYCKKIFPECREQFSLCSDPTNIIIFGGISTRSFNDTWVLNPITYNWKKIQYDSFTPFSRFGHTISLYDKKLYVYGGRSKQSNYVYNADLEVLNLDEKSWDYHPISKNILKTRRNHIAELINNQIFIHGGFDEDNEILGDSHLLNLSSNLKWSTVYAEGNINPPYLAGHASCLVLPKDLRYHPKTSIYRISEDKVQKSLYNRIKERGIYIFGGRKKDNALSNDLYVLKIGKKPLEWYKPETLGKPPSPRYLLSLNYYEEGNFVILYGGRNDKIKDNFALDDIYLLELSKLEWVEVKVHFDSPVNVFSRCGHCAVIYGKVIVNSDHKLIVMGGMNNNNYIGSALFLVELNEMNTNKEEKIKIDDVLKVDNKHDTIKMKKSLTEKNDKSIENNSNLYLPPIK